MDASLQYQLFYDYYYKGRNDPITNPNDLFICLLFEVFSPLIVGTAQQEWDRLPSYIRNSIPAGMRDIIKTSQSNPNLQADIDAYYVNRAINVLKSYRDCRVPYSNDPRVEAVSGVNLLSPAGENRLNELRLASQSSSISLETAEKAFTACSKFFLDLNLFQDMDHVLDIFNPMTQKTIGEESKDGSSLSMSSGCYNGCVHCLYSGCGPVSHMPYPLYRRIYHAIRQSNPLARITSYHDSDPLHYADPIIGADAGDM